jgi:hypothetical protein
MKVNDNGRAVQEAPPATDEEVAPYTSALLIVRHPERELMYEVFGDEPLVIELDLAKDFDVTRPDPEDQDKVATWVGDVREELATAGVTDEDDPLYLAVEMQLQRVMQLYNLTDNPDEDGDDIDPDAIPTFVCPECKCVTSGHMNEAGEYDCPVCGRGLDDDDLTDDLPPDAEAGEEHDCSYGGSVRCGKVGCMGMEDVS